MLKKLVLITALALPFSADAATWKEEQKQAAKIVGMCITMEDMKEFNDKLNGRGGDFLAMYSKAMLKTLDMSRMSEFRDLCNVVRGMVGE